VGEIGPGTAEARQHAVESLLTLVGAAVGALVFDPSYRPAGASATKAITHAGFDAATSRVLGGATSEGCSSIPTQLELMRRLGKHPKRERITATNKELLPQRTWDRSSWVNEYARPAGLDYFLSSVLPIEDGVVEATGFMREASDTPFNAEDREVLHLFLDGSGRMFRERVTPKVPVSTVALAPRVCEAFAQLLTGAADKEIAVRLGISVHTARQYVKTIYRAYGVNSRAQLIAHCHGADVAHIAA
jgi:DNA-binding CsgD family transcriptional regulator